MSAVLGIIRGHHGALTFYSEAGKGTTFKVLFPVSESETINDGRKALSFENDDGFGKGMVLIIDDEESIRDTAAAMVKEFGFNTLIAKDGIDGLEVYQRNKDEVVVVILDLTMPMLDGV